MRCLLDTSRVVDDNNFEVGVLAALPAAKELATDAAKTVDSDADLLGGDGYLAGASTRLQKGRGNGEKQAKKKYQ